MCDIIKPSTLTATKVNILGTEYSIHKKTYEEEPCLKENHWGGYCHPLEKEIVLLDLDKTEAWNKESQTARDISIKETLRHEIIHAFLNESGLQDNAGQPSGAWSKNEEMVDWFAIQSPKIFKVYEELGIL